MSTTPPSSAGGKVLTAFLAGAMFGAFAMVEFAPSGSSELTNASSPNNFTVQPDGSGTTGGGDGNSGTTGGDATDVTPATEGSGTGQDLAGQLTEALGEVTTGGTTGEDTTTGGSTETSGTTGTTGGGTTGDDGTTSGTAGGDTTDDATTGGNNTVGSDGTTGTSEGGTDGTGGTDTDGGSDGVSFDTGGGSGGSGSTSTGGATSDGCAANNGGETDTGISADKIRVAATVVDDGPGASLLQPATIGMQAVLNKVNRSGGVCGRRIELTTRNDSWDAQKGRQYIQRFIEDGHFALLVVPSSEGLAEAVKAGVIANAGIPVVGTTGLRIDEYKEPWVFPVSTATVSIMRIMARHAYDDGARSFGIVYDSKFKFGIEGKDAFVNYLESAYSDIEIKAVQPLDPDQSSYGTQAQKFNQDCGNDGGTPGCEMVALLLVPETAQKWANANPGDVAGRGKNTHGAQTLFTGAFANGCRGWCNGMTVWTGYVPPIAPVDQADGVQQYIEDVDNVSGSVDKTNQFLEGAYLGTQVFVDVIARCSPQVTRACVKETLDSTDFQSDLVSQLAWRPGQHHANKTAQAFKIKATGNSFNGWEWLDTGWIRDPTL